MHTTRRARRVLASFVTGAVIVAGSLLGGSAATAAPPVPAVMAALGDSITQAVMTCSSLTKCAANSWATGNTASVQSHATRLNLPDTAAARVNLAVSGAKSDALPGQAAAAVSKGAQYVTIEIGANDACTSTVAGMTPTGTLVKDDLKTFATRAKTAIGTLAGSGAEIFVAAIPNLKTLYTVNKGNSSARFTWSLLRICQSMLANPTKSTVGGADDLRRDAVQTRVNEYNAILAQLCTPAIKCRFGSAVATYAFQANEISTRDYFHPSLLGQTNLAAITWGQSQWAG